MKINIFFPRLKFSEIILKLRVFLIVILPSTNLINIFYVLKDSKVDYIILNAQVPNVMHNRFYDQTYI